MRQKIFAAIILLSFPVLVINAQQDFELQQSESKLIITGTSNLHDWDMEVEEMKGNITLEKRDNVNFQFKNVEIVIPSKGIRSHSSIMDGKAYEALKSDRYPLIKFRLTSVENIWTDGKNYKAEVGGLITIAGKTKGIEFNVQGIYNQNYMVSAKGKLDLLMSDFDIESPKAMMGTLRTGDKIDIDFEMKFVSTYRTDNSNN